MTNELARGACGSQERSTAHPRLGRGGGAGEGRPAVKAFDYNSVNKGRPCSWGKFPYLSASCTAEGMPQPTAKNNPKRIPLPPPPSARSFLFPVPLFVFQ